MKTVLVSSTKGGVGKTLIAINLAKILGKKGSTALIDADIDSSNFREMVDLGEVIQVDRSRFFKVPRWENIPVFSMSLLVGDRYITMTGDRYAQIIADSFSHSDIDFEHLDYLVIDMPAGASDIFKTIVGLFDESIVGGVIVTQPSSTVDARRVIKMHQFAGIPIVGIIENMATFECKCGEKYNIFGDPSAKAIEKEEGVEALGEIPLSMEIRKRVGSRKPMIPSKLLAPLNKAAKKIEEMEIAKVSIFAKAKQKIVKVSSDSLAKVLASLVTVTNRAFNLTEYQASVGFTEEKPANLVVTSPYTGKVVQDIQVTLKGGFLKCARPESRIKPEFEVEMDYRTLARVIMGYMKLDGRAIPFDYWDAWCADAIHVYGTGSTPKVISVLQTVLTDEGALSQVRGKFEKILTPLL